MKALEAAVTLLTDAQNQQLIDPHAAVLLARQTCENLGYQNPFALRCLTVALAAAGERAEALQIAEKAYGLAHPDRDQDLRHELEGYFQALRAPGPTQ